MKSLKVIGIIILLFLTFNAYSQTNKNQIVIGEVDSLYSKTLKEYREFWVYTPKDFDRKKNYPVIYVLDASSHYHVITGMLKRLSPLQVPESIVVGITNTDRTRDFTPTTVKLSRRHNTETSGGAENFKKFLKQELQCYIEEKYPIEKNTTLIGHSTAGLFTLYAFLYDQNSFDNYIAIDPSLWWDNENLAKQSQQLINEGHFKGKSLYVAVANSIGKKMDTTKVRRDRSEITESIRANLKFHDVLVKNNKKLDFKWEYFANEDHGGITVPAQYNGLRSAFSWFPFRELWRFNTPKSYSATELTEPFYTHYKNLSIRMKRDMKPDWQLVNDIGQFMLEGHNLPKKALAYLEMNVHFYPNTSETYLALGNYYASQKNKSEAIKNYKKAIEIDGNKEAKQKLSKL